MEQQIDRAAVRIGTPPLLKDKVTFSHEIKGQSFNVPFHASCRPEYCTDGGITSLEVLGVPTEFRFNTEARGIWIDRKTGAPSFTEQPIADAARLTIRGEMLSYTVFDERPGEGFRLVCVGCGERAFYINFVLGKQPARFFVDAPVYQGRHAIRELLQMNLLKGPRPYERTANQVPGFFKRAVGAVYTKHTILSLKTATLKGRNEDGCFAAKIYLTPGDFKSTILSVQGWCFDYDLDYYPKWQQILVERYQERTSRPPRSIKQSKRVLEEA
jgi:hypothetical protein